MIARARFLALACCSITVIWWVGTAKGQQPVPPKPVVAGSLNEDMPQLRAKAWALFHQLRLSGIPNSPNWVHEFTAYHRAPAGEAAKKAWTGMRALELSADVLPILANGPQPVDPVPFESTFFNDKAVESIARKPLPLHDPGTAAKLRDQLHRREIDDFLEGSMAIKTFWRALPLNGDPVSVGIWEWPRQDGTEVVPVPDLPEESWSASECVQRNPPPGSKCLRAEDAFYTATVKTPNAFCPSDNSTRCEGLREGQMLIMIAAHIVKRDRPDWFWATFWWKGSRKDGTSYRTNGNLWTCDNAQRPGDFPSPWNNYSMDVTVSSTALKPEPANQAERTACGYPKKFGSYDEARMATFNPFVEGHIKPYNGRKSNCVVCHARANSKVQINVRDVQAVNYPNGFQLAPFEGHIRTDYMWTVRKYFGMTP